jgi:putative ABC transport system substrate-binding protein
MSSPPRAGRDMKRREFIGLIGSMAAWPLAARALPPAGKLTTVGVLAPLSYPAVEGLRLGFRELGYVETQNLRLEYRWADGPTHQFDAVVAELVGLRVDALVTYATPAALAAQRATRTIPIVLAAVGDPVGSGLVASLARPGANVTGFASVSPELEVKRLELMTHLLPNLKRVGLLWNASTPPVVIAEAAVQEAARGLGLAVASISLRDPTGFEVAFADLRREQPDGVLVLSDSMLLVHQQRIIAFMADARLPAMYAHQDTVKAGGLLSYGAVYADLFRRAAGYVDRIVNGAKPADLPVEQPTKLELVINLKTARLLGIEIPPQLLASADEVIE